MRSKQFVAVPRDSGDKQSYDKAAAITTIQQILSDIQERLFTK